MLRKYLTHPEHILNWKELTLDEGATFEEQAVEIVDEQEKVLRRKKIKLFKVLWRHQGIEETTWEREDWLQANHPNLFENRGTTLISGTKFCLRGVDCKDPFFW